MSVKAYRVTMNLVTTLATLYWAIVLYILVFDGVEIISMPLRFIGYLMAFVVTVLVCCGFSVYNNAPRLERQRTTEFEAYYWLLGVGMFVTFLLVGAIRG